MLDLRGEDLPRSELLTAASECATKSNLLEPQEMPSWDDDPTEGRCSLESSHTRKLFLPHELLMSKEGPA